MRKTGKIFYTMSRFAILTFIVGLFSFHVLGIAAELEVIPSSTEINEDENLSLEFRISSDSSNEEISAPSYTSPDFDEVNVYSRTTGIQTYIMNGSISVKRTQSIVVVLHPKKTGKLKISNINVKIGSKITRASDIVIDVYDSGAMKKAPNQPNYFGFQNRRLPPTGIHSGKNGEGRGPNVLIRTEPNKLRAYKGEQIILTYALYSRVSIVGMQVERYPTVPGFLKEDMDIPILTGRLNYQPSVLNGQEYKRAVLAQYAVFPVKDGTLSIDSFTAKVSYRGRHPIGIGGDDDDPFGITQFFQSMQATATTVSSDRVNIEVLPLPAAGQPANFSSLVGDFNITAMVDKYTTKVGDPINVKVKIDGNGHAGSLEHLNVMWPVDFEQYEDKSNTTFQKSGYSERLFEFMLVPKTKGKFKLPAIEIAMFNPQTRSYITRASQPIDIEVLEGSLGNVYVAKGNGSAQASPNQDIRYWMASDPAPSSSIKLASRVLAGGSVFLLFLSILATVAPRFNKEERRERAGKYLLSRAQALGSQKLSPLDALGEIEDIVRDLLSAQYGIRIGSLTRNEIRKALLNVSVDEQTAKEIESLLERCENLRFLPKDAVSGSEKIALESSAQLVQLVERLYRV